MRGLADLVCVVFVQHLDGLIELLLLMLLEGDEVAQIQLVLAVLQGAIVVHIVYLRGQARQTEQEVRLHHIHLRIHIRGALLALWWYRSHRSLRLLCLLYLLLDVGAWTKLKIHVLNILRCIYL